MKLTCASGAFDRTLVRGDLTQLEWMEHCARELACDGVVVDTRHFPRIDDDYLAQIKKFATDLGLTIAAVNDEAFFACDESGIAATLAIATALGAPLVTARLSSETARSWSEQAATLNQATGQAKAANITLAVRNAPGTFAGSARDCKRAMKEADSAWLRLGIEPQAFGPDEDATPLVDKTVLLWERYDAAQTIAIEPAWADRRCALVLDDPQGSATLPAMQNALRRIRNALATRELNRT